MNSTHTLTAPTDPFTTAGDTLTRLTRDLTAALEYATTHPTDTQARIRVFAYTHLTRELTGILSQAPWRGTHAAGESALVFLANQAHHTPAFVPDWLRIIAPGWVAPTAEGEVAALLTAAVSTPTVTRGSRARRSEHNFGEPGNAGVTSDTGGERDTSIIFNFVGSIDMAERLARELLHDRLPQRWHHTQGVAHTATTLATRLNLTPTDRALLICSAWLHDIGYANPTAYNWHPLDGALLLRGMELDLVADQVAWHTTAEEEAHYLHLSDQLAVFSKPTGMVAAALTYADMTTSPDGEPVTFEQRLEELEQRRGVDSFQAVTMRRAWDRLQQIRATIDQALHSAPRD